MRARGLAVVTGATAGIGLEFARQLAARGHDLLLVARDAGRLDQLALDLSRTHGVVATPHPADLSSAAGIASVVAWLSAHPCDVMVHSAGFGTRGLLHRSDGAAQEAMVTLHVTATDQLVRATLPGMLARRTGRLVVVSSVASFTVSAGNVNYAATKAYQRTYVEGLALELRGTGVAAQALCPGFTRTEFHARASMKMGGIPRWLWMDVGPVVTASLAALERGRPAVVVPGWRWRAIAWLMRHLPRGMQRAGARRYRRTRA